MDVRRYFKILGLDRNASLDDLKILYRAQVKAWHPDRLSERSPQVRQKAEERLKEINLAYENLRSYFMLKQHKNAQDWWKCKIKFEKRDINASESNLDQENRGGVLHWGMILALASVLAIGCLIVGYFTVITNRIHQQTRHAYTTEFEEYRKDELKLTGSGPQIARPMYISKKNQSIVGQAVDAFQKERFPYAVALLEDGIRENIRYVPGTEDLYIQSLQEWAASLFDTDPHKAQALLRKAIELSPENAKSHFYLGKFYTKLKDYPKAINYYCRAIDLDPSYHKSLFNLAFVYAVTTDYPSAEQTINKLIDLSPPYVDEAYFNLAMVQHLQGKRQQSIGNLERALEFNSKNLKARKYLLRFKVN